MKKLLPVISFLFIFFSPLTVFASSSVSSTEQVALTEVLTDEVAAANNITFEGSQDVTLSSQNYYALIGSTSSNFTLASGLNANSVYSLDLSVNMTITPSVVVDSMRLRSFHVYFDDFFITTRSSVALPFEFTRDFTLTMTGQEAMSTYQMTTRAIATNTTALSTFTLDFDYEIIVNSITALSDAESDDYTNGYNAGYSAGESAGYSSGYSDGYATGESEGYESGYQAGVESVDTDSYYDAGYQAGYDDAYQFGYDEGYSSGYDDAMARVEEWGADTTEYPVYIGGFSVSDYTYADFVNWYWPVDVDRFLNFSELNSFSIDPNHTYKFVVDIFGLSFDYNRSLEYRPYWTSVKLFLDVNGSRYVLSSRSSSNTNFYVPGDLMSTSFDIGIEISDLRTIYHENTYEGGEWIFSFDDLNVMVYDCGPSGDTQNHIANQTDQLMNTDPDNTDAFNNANESFNDTVNDAHSVEQSLTDNAFTNVGSATSEYFTQPSTNVLAGAAFYTACINGLYNNMGDFKYILFVGLMFIILRFIFRKVKGG